MHVPILIATIAILIVAIIVFYYKRIHPYIAIPTVGSAVVRFFGSVGLTLLIVLLSNIIIWVFLWGADWIDLFSERNLVLYGIVMLFASCCSTVYTLWFAWRHRSK